MSSGRSGTSPADPAPASWSVVVPVKLLPMAKSRLSLLPEQRESLALAMALDTVTAALACTLVEQVVVVTDDVRAAEEAAAAGAYVVADEPGAGLNAALEHGAGIASARLPTLGVVALAGDLPAMHPAELGAVLTAAAAHPRAVLADAAGDGTVLLAVSAGIPLDPRYGADSLTAHSSSGAVALDVDAPGLRRDVDTVGDLAAAVRLGCGPRTHALAVALLDTNAH